MKILYGNHYQVIDKDSKYYRETGLALVPINKFIIPACRGDGINPIDFDHRIHIVLKNLSDKLIVASKDKLRLVTEMEWMLLAAEFNKAKG